jgi:hypothetical protein
MALALYRTKSPQQYLLAWNDEVSTTFFGTNDIAKGLEVELERKPTFCQDV